MNGGTIWSGVRGRAAVVLSALSVLALAVVATVARASGDRPSLVEVTATVADVAWIAGHWEAKRPGVLLEERWSEPAGDSMMGMFRWIKQDKTWMYELLTISEENGSLVFRFRHFGNTLKAWEETDRPLMFRLVSLTDREAVFMNPVGEGPGRYIFSRPDENTLVVKVESEKSGSVELNEFRYDRK